MEYLLPNSEIIMPKLGTAAPLCTNTYLKTCCPVEKLYNYRYAYTFIADRSLEVHAVYTFLFNKYVDITILRYHYTLNSLFIFHTDSEMHPHPIDPERHLSTLDSHPLGFLII